MSKEIKGDFVCFLNPLMPISQNGQTHTQTIRQQFAGKLFAFV